MSIELSKYGSLHNKGLIAKQAFSVWFYDVLTFYESYNCYIIVTVPLANRV